MADAGRRPTRRPAVCFRLSAIGAEVLGLACHVGEWDAIPGFIEAVVERFGLIDGVVNNAGINPARIGPADMTLEYWRKVFSVNLEGHCA